MRAFDTRYIGPWDVFDFPFFGSFSKNILQRILGCPVVPLSFFFWGGGEGLGSLTNPLKQKRAPFDPRFPGAT